MEYPLFILGRRAGTVRISQQGLYTHVEARAPELKEGFFRISLYGEGESSYLGLMEPGEQGMYLLRRLTRSERQKLPGKIEYASDDVSLHNQKDSGKTAEKYGDKEKVSLHKTKNLFPLQQKEGADYAEAEGRLWQRRKDGSLVAEDGEGLLLALPAKLKRPAGAARMCSIDGQEYMVFRY